MQLFEQTASGIVAATPESSDTLSEADLASLRQTPGVYEAYQGLGKLSGSLRVLASWPAANMRERERDGGRDREKERKQKITEVAATTRRMREVRAINTDLTQRSRGSVSGDLS